MARTNLMGLMGMGILALAVASRAQQPEGHHDLAKHMEQMNQKMVEQLGKGDKEFDKRFIDLMIPHHEGAVMMSQHALKHATKPELKEMAQKMIDSQKREIEQLKKWRAEWYSDKAKDAGR